ncbi:hypothetical protein B0H16DRAFT_1691520 [Mycena metata]|uniref:Uncharacterized protein n=1 Tax=Mycena metata TaxID=1033252 RepID=A0AAD7N8S3_9AGAR|nr:hypothetical protein B0H16DRAFT_1691520 [Mycena metata]
MNDLVIQLDGGVVNSSCLRRNSRVVDGTKRERMSLGGGYTVGVHLEHYFRGLRGEGKCGIFSINILQGEMSCRFRHRAAGSRDNVGLSIEIRKSGTGPGLLVYCQGTWKEGRKEGRKYYKN